MSSTSATLEILPSDRSRMIKIAVAGLLLTLMLFGLFLSSALSWMFSPARYSENTSKEIELVSSGQTFQNPDGETLLLAETKAGDPVVVGHLDNREIPSKGESLKVWYYSEEDTRATMAGSMTSSSAGEGYYTFKKLKPQLQYSSDGIWVILLSFGSVAFCLLIHLFITLIDFSRKLDRSLPLVASTRSGMFKSIKNYLSDEEMKPSDVTLKVITITHELIFFATLFFWTSSPGEHSYDLLLVLVVSVFHFLVGFLLFAVALTCTEALTSFLLSRVIVSDPGRFPVSVIKSEKGEDIQDAPAWIYKWLDKNSWHQETATVLLEDFDGTLQEICAISESLGPDKDLQDLAR